MLKLAGLLILVPSLLAQEDSVDTAAVAEPRALPVAQNTQPPEVCKYSKGAWSQCNTMTKLEEREDEVRRGVSDPGCPPTRKITRNCKKDKRISQKKNIAKENQQCVYAKPKVADWSPCQSGVKTKSLELLRENQGAGCPKTKVISKKCKNSKKDKKKNGKKKVKKNEKRWNKKKNGKANKMEKKELKLSARCEYGSWSPYSPCKDGFQSRMRKIVRGEKMKLCQRHATHAQKC